MSDSTDTSINTGSTPQYHRISEVAKLFDVRTSVLRFWEDTFDELSPERTSKGHRLYRDSDVAVVRRIKDLLYDQGMTIEGAKRILLKEHGKGSSGSAAASALSAEEIEFFDGITKELLDVRALLKQDIDVPNEDPEAL